MRVLIDECVPRKFKAHLAGHECHTVPEAGFAGKQNGELLKLAEGQFEVLVTLDKGMQYQQNLTGRTIAVLIIPAKSNRLEDIVIHVPACLIALESIQPGQIVRV